MRYPKSNERISRLLTGRAERSRRLIILTGSVSLMAYILFVILPFFIPNTDSSHFPPYLALPETGFELSNYYLLYTFICVNALAIFGLYLLALRASGGRNEEEGAPAGRDTGDDEKSDRLSRVIIGFSIAFHLLMLISPFLLSTDIFDYIRHGRILSVYGENPLVIPATYFPDDPFFGLGGWVGTGSVYGSLHVYIMALLARVAGDGFAANFFLFKGFFVGLDLVNLWLIWKIAARLKPGLKSKALLFYGWNPFILTLVVANAHNDILMLTLVLAGVLLYLDKRLILGAVCLALATLVKFITLPILLVYVAMIVRQQKGLARRILMGAGTLGLCAAIFIVSYLPLWAGRETFNYLTTVGQKTNFTLSSLIRDAAASHVQLSVSNTIVQFSLAALLTVYLIWHIAGVRDIRGFISAAAGLAFLTPLVLFWFQPWYLTLALGLLALRPWRLLYVAALAFSFSVMFFDSFWWHAPVSMDVQKPMRVLVVFGPPVLLLAYLKGREAFPRAWRKVLNWSLQQAAGNRPAMAGVTDPSPVRLVVEVGVLMAAAVVPAALIISTSPQLRYLAELMMLKLRLLVG